MSRWLFDSVLYKKGKIRGSELASISGSCVLGIIGGQSTLFITISSTTFLGSAQLQRVKFQLEEEGTNIISGQTSFTVCIEAIFA